VALDGRATPGDEIQVLDVGDPFLEQLAPPDAAAGHEGEGPLGVGVLGEHHDPEPGVGAAEAFRGADALVGVRAGMPGMPAW
jgi:hypothetical protein